MRYHYLFLGLGVNRMYIKLNHAITSSYTALDDLHAMVELHHRIPSVTEALLTLHQNLEETKLGKSSKCS